MSYFTYTSGLSRFRSYSPPLPEPTPPRYRVFALCTRERHWQLWDMTAGALLTQGTAKDVMQYAREHDWAIDTGVAFSRWPN